MVVCRQRCPSTLTRIFHRFLLRRRTLVWDLRYVSARESQRVRNMPLVASHTHQLAPPHHKTGEISALARSAVKTLLVAKGIPGENGYIESAGGKLRDELFSWELLFSQEGARGLIDR